MRSIPHPFAAGLVVCLASLAGAQQPTIPRALPGDTTPAPAALVEADFDIASGFGLHLVAWVDYRSDLAAITQHNPYSSSGKSDVFARLLDGDGNPVGDAPLLLSSLPWEAGTAKVAFNGTDAFLVVWRSRETSQFGSSTGIRGVRVNTGGEILDPTPILIDNTIGVPEGFPDVAGMNGEWMVAWNDYAQNPTRIAVFGAIVANDGQVTTKGMLQDGSTGFYAPNYPALESLADRYLVVWEHYGPGGPDWNVYGRMYDSAMSAVGGEFLIAGAGVETKARVASNGTEALVTWNGSHVALVTAAGTVSPVEGVPLANAGATGEFADPTWLQDRWLITTWTSGGLLLGEEWTPTLGLISQYPLFSRPPLISQCVASGSTDRAVVVWGDHTLASSDMAGAWTRAGGVTGTIRTLGDSPPNQVSVDLDGSSTDGFGVVWIDALSGRNEIQWQRLDASGLPVDPEPTQVDVGIGAVYLNVAIARGLDVDLVVWEDLGSSISSTLDDRILAKRIDHATGQVLDPQPIVVLPGNTPDVAFESGVFLVVSTHEPVNHQRPVRAIRVGQDGSLIDPQYLTIGPSYARHPSVGAAAGTFLVAWEKYSTHNSASSYIQGATVPVSGGASGTFAVESLSGSTYNPFVAASDTEFFVAYSGPEDVWGRVVTLGGAPQGQPSGVHLSYAPNEQTLPTAASWNGGWTAAWTDYRASAAHDHEPGIGDVFGARLDSGLALLDPDGTPIASGTWIEGRPVMAGDDNLVVIAYTGWDPDSGAFRTFISRVTSDQLGVRSCPPSAPNSSGTFASIHARGSNEAFVNDVELIAEGGPPGYFGYFMASEGSTLVLNPGGSQGNLCLGGAEPIGRFNQLVFQFSGAGTASVTPDLSAVPIGPPIPVFPGETWYFQAWFRDLNPGFTSNFTDAIGIEFQ